MKASARSMSTHSRFGFGRSEVGHVAARNGQGTRLRLLRLLPPLASVALLLALAAPMASATPTARPGYGYLTAFSSEEFLGYKETPPTPMALDSHGNIFVANESAEAIAAFSPDPVLGGTPLTTIHAAEFTPRDIAIDPVTEAIYEQQYYAYLTPIRRFISDGAATPTYTLDPSFEVPPGAGIAVDPTTRDLLVTNAGAGTISRYDTTGALLSTISTPGISPFYISIGSDGSIYVGGSGTIMHFSAAGALIREFATGGGIPAVNPVTGVLVVALGDHLKGYSPAGELLFDTLMPFDNPAGVSIDGDSGRLYVFNTNSVAVFLPAAYPGIEPPVVSEVTTTTAHVSSEVDPGKEPDNSLPQGSTLHFEYKVAGASSWESTPDQPLGGPEAADADLAGLEPNLDYLVRAKASNSLTFHISDPTAFHTAPVPPTTETNDATDVGETSAVLNGTTNPLGLPTTYHFEFGTTISYGSRAPAGIEAVAGADRNNRRLGRTINGLEPGTTYHFRLVAKNSAGINQGDDRTFTTAAAGGISHRAYEQVTPVDKGGAPIWEKFGFQAKDDGSGISYFTQGSPTSAPLDSTSMSLRDGADWTGGINLDPPLNRTAGEIVSFTVMAVSADFTHTLVATNRKLTPDAVEDGPERANIYVVDLATGGHTLVGTAPNALGYLVGEGGAGSVFIAGAPDLSWVVLRSPRPLLPEAPADAVYRWSAAGGLEVISVLPQGEIEATYMSSYREFFVRSVSDDGSRIYFGVAGPKAGLYLWEAGAPSKAVSVSHIPGDPATPHRAVLAGASKDGRYAFFYTVGDAFPPTGGDVLTSDTPSNGAFGGSMYRYDASDGSLEFVGQASAQGYDFTTPMGVSDDGQTAYWTAPEHSGTLVWRNGVVKTATTSAVPSGEDPAAISPNGRYFAYMEGQSVYTGPGNVYLYDAETDQRSCVSCLPDGSPGFGYLPEMARTVSNRSMQAVTNAGQVFFTSFGRLAAADVNGSEDVYEYKDGKNRLISPGNAPFNAILADISEDGSNVFFTTPQKLVGQDNDKSPDIYDARIGGGLAKQSPPPPQECIRDDCKSTPNGGPELPFGGSEALSGPGNVSGEPRKRCAKGTHALTAKGKTRCAKQAPAKRKAKHAKRTHTNRRQGR